MDFMRYIFVGVIALLVTAFCAIGLPMTPTVSHEVASHASGEGQGGFLLVKSVVLEDERQDTYNFEVAETHTYFVGKLNALVHNACSGDDLIGNGGRFLGGDPDTIIGVHGNRYTLDADGLYTNQGPATQAQISEAGVTVIPAANRTPTYRIGDSDGGPGAWTHENETFLSDAARAYQQMVTGAPDGTTYVITASNVPTGRTSFDGYHPQTNVLLMLIAGRGGRITV